MPSESTPASDSCGVYTARSIAHALIRGGDCALLAAGVLGVLFLVPVLFGTQLSIPVRLAIAVLVPLGLTLAVLALSSHFTRPRGLFLFTDSGPRKVLSFLALAGPMAFLLLCGVRGITQREQDLLDFNAKLQDATREIGDARTKADEFLRLTTDAYGREDRPEARNLAFLGQSRAFGLNEELVSLEQRMTAAEAGFREQPMKDNADWAFVSTTVPNECAAHRDKLEAWSNEIKSALAKEPEANLVAFDVKDIEDLIQTLQSMIDEASRLQVASQAFVKGEEVSKGIDTLTGEALNDIKAVRDALREAREEWLGSNRTTNTKLQSARPVCLAKLSLMIGKLDSAIKGWKGTLGTLVRLGKDQLPIDRKPWTDARMRALRTIEEADKLSTKAALVNKSAMVGEIDTNSVKWKSKLQELTEEFGRQIQVWSSSTETDHNAKRQIEQVIPTNLASLVDEWMKQNDLWRKQLDIPHPTTRLEDKDFDYWLRAIFSFGLGGGRRMEVVMQDYEDAFKAGKTPDTTVLEKAMNEAKSEAEKMMLVNASLQVAERAHLEGRINKEQLETFRARVNDLKNGINLPEIQRTVIASAERSDKCEDMRSLLTGAPLPGQSQKTFRSLVERDQVREALGLVGNTATVKYWNNCLADVPIQK